MSICFFRIITRRIITSFREYFKSSFACNQASILLNTQSVVISFTNKQRLRIDMHPKSQTHLEVHIFMGKTAAAPFFKTSRVIF